MTAGKRLGLIAAGYALALGGGVAAVTLNELRMSAETLQGSPGMVAFGDVTLFILASGVCALAPTWFLLKLLAERDARALVKTELVLAALGPLSWLAVVWLAGDAPGTRPVSPGLVMLGPLVAFGAIPRMVLGPVLIVVEAMTCFMIGERRARALLAAAMLADIAPIGLFALHMARAVHAR